MGSKSINCTMIVEDDKLIIISQQLMQQNLHLSPAWRLGYTALLYRNPASLVHVFVCSLETSEGSNEMVSKYINYTMELYCSYYGSIVQWRMINTILSLNIWCNKIYISAQHGNQDISPIYIGITTVAILPPYSM